MLTILAKVFFLGRGVVGFFASSFQIISQSNNVDNMLHQGKATAHSCIRSAAHWLGIRSERGHWLGAMESLLLWRKSRVSWFRDSENKFLTFKILLVLLSSLNDFESHPLSSENTSLQTSAHNYWSWKSPLLQPQWERSSACVVM